MTPFQSKPTALWKPALVQVLSLGIGSLSPIFIKLAQGEGLPSPFIAAGRMLLAAIILTPIVLTRYHHELRRLSRRDVLMALLAGAWLATHFMAIIFALESISVLLFVVILNTGPLWTALLERTFLKERLSTTVWFGLLVTIVGGIVIGLFSRGDASEGGTSLLGLALILFGAISASAYLTIGRSVRAKVSLFPYVWIVFGFGAIINVTIALAIGTSFTGYSVEGYVWLAALAILVQLMAHSGFNYAIEFFSATLISITGQSITILSTIAAYLVFNEIPGLNDIAGGAVIITGVIIAIIGRSRMGRKRKSAA